MTSLDKNTLYYFRDEIEKTAIIVPLAKGVAKMVMSAGRAAGSAVAGGTKGVYGGFKKQLASKAVAGGGTANAGHALGAGALTAMTGGAGIYGANKGIKAFAKNSKELKRLGPKGPSGIQQL